MQSTVLGRWECFGDSGLHTEKWMVLAGDR